MAVDMENVAIPITLSAFALTPECAESLGPDRIGILAQPNYMGLRLDEALMQHDLVDHVDFHRSAPPELNARLTDIGAALQDADPPPYRRNRMGVYLHWSLPRCYRAALRAKENQRPPGIRPDGEEEDLSTPQFPTVPNRWLVVRRLTSYLADDGAAMPTYQTWVVESNRVRRIQDVEDTVDIEVEVSPFMRGNTDPTDPDWKKVLERQTEICLGRRNEYSGWPNNPPVWTEQERGVENEVEFMDLTVLSSSNPLFPDYTPHNGSVFSIVDNFKYRTQDGTIKYLLEAKADYFVIGWNSLSKSDILSTPTPIPLGELLSNTNLSLSAPEGSTDEEKTRITELLESKGGTRSVIHGAIYGVSFKWGAKPPGKVETVAAKFGKGVTMEPLSAGVTPLDGVITFLRAHKGSEVDSIFGDDNADEIAKMVLTLSDLLYAANDSFDERAKAQDINTYDALYGKSINSGYTWNFAEPSETGQPPKAPTPAQFATLMALNEKQSRFDSLDRKLLQIRQDLFCEWWKYVSDKTNILNTTQGEFRARVTDLAAKIKELEVVISSLVVDLGQAQKNPSFKRVVEDPFYTRKEPTICIAGLESGWPKDFLNVLPVRVESQIDSTVNGVETEIFSGLASPFPLALRDTALKLLGEYKALVADAVPTTPRRGVQSWGDENPFEPLFMEWEALYYHVDRSKWTVDVRPSPVGLPTKHLRYGVTTEILSQNTQNQKDKRWISGRTLILPQPIFSLKVAVEAVLDSNEPNAPFRDPKERKQLMDGIDILQFMSCPLTGLQEHLQTRVIGTHVKPTLNKPGRTNVPLIPAAKPEIGFTEDVLKLIDSMSEVTPYGNLQDFPSTEYPMPPFKSVTHGQLIITKLNIIDRFGQAVALPPPKPKLRIPPTVPETVHPCLSDFLIPDVIGNTLNTIYPETVPPDQGDWPLCRFLQLTPAINQNARLNSTFVNKSFTPGFPFWNETENDKPESPILGWIILNYQNSGLQLFRPDGRFYREVRVGGPHKAVLGSKWLPFDPPASGDQTVAPQLDELIKKLVDKSDNGRFLKSFFHMITGAVRTMPYAPSEYSGYANALVGKPLALVNVGFSLELATPALKAQNTLGKVPVNEQDELSSYRFPIKLGDAERPFDGVVGWFDTDNIINNGRTNWNRVYTYAPDPDNPDFILSTPQNFMRLSPYYLDPIVLKATGSDQTFATYKQARTAQYIIKTMLVDPYTPIHAYSPILPVTSLSLPSWIIQQAMTRMTAFYRLGPALVSIDVPSKYDESRKLNPDTWATPLPSGAGTESPAMPAIRLPVTGKKGLWRWLQPYDVPGATEVASHVTRYNEMDVNQEDTTIRKDPPPYTMVEGYLQLARPLLSSDIAHLAPPGQ